MPKVSITEETTAFPLWVGEFDNSPRHCFRNIDGGYDTPTGYRRCYIASEHPLRAGNVEWLRFIHAFNKFAKGVFTDFPEGNLKFGNRTMMAPGYQGNVRYCEAYGESIRVFLDKESEWAVIEIDDPNLFEAANNAAEAVRNEYRQEFPELVGA
jgi:hypothetical protein